MNIFKLSIKNLFYRPLSSLLSLLLLALGVSMISLLVLINSVVQDQMNNNLKGIDMVVGAKGSPLQLILSSVYHVDSPTGNIPLKEAKAIVDGAPASVKEGANKEEAETAKSQLEEAGATVELK